MLDLNGQWKVMNERANLKIYTSLSKEQTIDIGFVLDPDGGVYLGSINDGRKSF